MESFRLCILLLLGSMFYTPSLQAQQYRMTIEEVWSKTDVNSKKIKQQRQLADVGKAAIAAAKDERLPEFTIHGEYARVSDLPVYENGLFHTPSQFPVVHETYGAGAEGYLNIYNGGATEREIKAKELEQEVAEERLHLTRSDVHYKAACYFLDIYRNSEYLRLVEQDIIQREEQLKEIRQLFTNGVVLKSDVLRAEQALADQQLLRTRVQNSILLANRQLNVLTGDPFESSCFPLVQKDSLAIITPADQYSIDQSFLLHIAEKETALSELHYKQVKSSVLPKIGLFAQYNYSYPQIMFYPYSIAMYSFGMAGVKASFRISELYQNRHKKEVARMLVESHRTEDEDLRENLRQEADHAAVRYKEAVTRIRVARENIDRAGETYRITSNTYFAQTALLTDLLNAETQLLQSQLNYVTEKVNAQVLYYQLLKTTGNL